MQELHETIGEAVNLGARHDDDIVYLSSAPRPAARWWRVVYLVGGRAPLHLTSLGKLFLAMPSRRRQFATTPAAPACPARRRTP